MKIERKKNAARNAFFGVLLRIYNMLLPFVMRTAMIYLLGVEYLGLNSLFTSILQVLNLAELGVGNAMVFSMYKPIAVDDNEKIDALMNLYRIYYRIIGGVVLGAGLILLPFVPHLIAGKIPDDINVYVLYILNLLATVFTYWLFAYRNSILDAYQRTDVISKIALVTTSIQYIVQLMVLAVFHNYYYYVITIIVTQILNNCITAAVTRKMYPQYEPKGKLSREEKHDINGRVKDVFTSKVGGTILNSADTIVISSFLGLRVLAIYQNYYYIMSAVMAIFSILFASITAGVGNSLITETPEKNYKDYRKVTLMTFLIMGICMSEMICLYQPFMELWVGKSLMLSNGMVLLFCIYFLIVEYVMLASVYKDAAGIWHEDRFRPLISGIVNLGLNLVLVHNFGLFGIVVSTILSAGIVSAPWITHNVFTFIFKGRFKEYAPLLLQCFIAVLFSMIGAYAVCNFINVVGIVGVITKGVIALIVSMFILFICTYKLQEMDSIKEMTYSILRGKR